MDINVFYVDTEVQEMDGYEIHHSLIVFEDPLDSSIIYRHRVKTDGWATDIESINEYEDKKTLVESDNFPMKMGEIGSFPDSFRDVVEKG